MNQPNNSQVAYNDPGNIDVWHNPTEHTFVVGCHIDHKGGPIGPGAPRGGPRKQMFRFEPHTDTPVPVEFRYVIQQYECGHPDCRTSPGSKLCFKDHEATVVGGQCPQLVRKNAPHIRQNPRFDPSWVEIRKVDATGRVFYELEKARPSPENAPPLRAKAPPEAREGSK